MIVTGVTRPDAELIEDLVEQYGIAFDTSDRELILACFTDDVYLNYLNGQKVIRGITAVRQQMFRFDAGETQPLAGVDRIVFSDHRFRVDRLRGTADGDVSGRVSGVVHLLTERDGQASLAIRGIRYTDRYVRTAAGWRIAERRHEQLWQSVAPARRFEVTQERSPLDAPVRDRPLVGAGNRRQLGAHPLADRDPGAALAEQHAG